MGFEKTILKAGNGLKPRRGQTVTVHCTGFGKNRDLTQKFWCTYIWDDGSRSEDDDDNDDDR